ncbi:MAG: ATPase inhibitor subunit zeta [Pseudobdellovibrionaceae bacterium]
MKNVMSFEDRGRGYEAKMALDSEITFKIEAKTNALVAIWAAERMGLKDQQAETFVADLTNLTFLHKTRDAFKERILTDFSANKIEISDNALERLIQLKAQMARKHILKES